MNLKLRLLAVQPFYKIRTENQVFNHKTEITKECLHPRQKHY